MRQAVGQFAVVGDEDQAFAVHVQSSDGEQPCVAVRDQIDDPRPACLVAIGRDHASGLVHSIVNAAAQRKRFAIDADILRVHLNAGAEFGHDLAIDLDAARGDQLFTLAAAAETGGGEDFLQARRRDARPLAARPAVDDAVSRRDGVLETR